MKAAMNRKGDASSAHQPAIKKKATPDITNSTTATVGVNMARIEPTSPIRTTARPQKKCDWSAVIPKVLPRTWKEEYRMLMIKAMTTPTSPRIRAIVRRTVDFLLIKIN